MTQNAETTKNAEWKKKKREREREEEEEKEMEMQPRQSSQARLGCRAWPKSAHAT